LGKIMTRLGGPVGVGGPVAASRVTLVWIDSREAIVARPDDGSPRLERIESEIPAHHRATGHVRHDPRLRHGGGGVSQTAGEPHRLEHRERFLDRVALRLPVEDDLVLIGPGTMREHLERRIRETDEHQRRTRRVATEASTRLTDRQLIARLNRLGGAEPRRRTVGAYRWSVKPTKRPSGAPATLPRRVLEKPPRVVEPGEG
jgi:hypothetical protein